MLIEQVILDEDGGGDALQAMIMLASRPHRVKLLGVTTAFGNTGHDTALQNNGSLLRFIGLDDIPYFPGAAVPLDRIQLEGDGAHGPDGKGGVILPLPRRKPETKLSVDFILDTLRKHPKGTITILAAAAQTNLAAAFRRDPATMRMAKQFLIMGGCTQPIPAYDMDWRQGNITPQAEFNVYMAAADAKTILESGLPIILFPMNVTHQLTFTPHRERLLRNALHDHPQIIETLAGLIKAPEKIDRKKFDSDSVMHDVNPAGYLLHPELYAGRRGHVTVTIDDDPTKPDSPHGRSDFTPDPASSTIVIENLKNPDLLYNHFLTATYHRFGTPPAPGRNWQPPVPPLPDKWRSPPVGKATIN